MTDADRQRLAAILGMLGSEHAGERAAAGLQAEAFRRKHGLTWEEMLQPVVLNIPARQPEPPAPRAPEPPPPSPKLYPFEFAPWTPIPLTPSAPPKKRQWWAPASYVAIMASPIVIAVLDRLFN